MKTLPIFPTATINSEEWLMADFLGMMKQAAQLQSKMQAMQEELGHVEVEGISGGGLVTVRMTAKMEVKSVKIDPSLIKADELEILEDLLVTAHNDARRKAEAAMQEELGHVEVEGISGGGLVAVRMTAKMEVKAVKIDPSLIKPEEREILEDLLVTAHNDAQRKAEAAVQEKMQALTGGLGLPPGLGLG